MTTPGPPLKALVADSLHEEALEALRERFDVKAGEVRRREILDIIGAYDILVVRSRTRVTREVLRRGKRLRVVARAGVGVDNIDVEAATERGILVVNAPAGSSQSVAELTVGLMLSLARRIPQAHQSVKAGRWEKANLRGRELAGKVLGLVGSGRIGGLVARICQGFGMETITFDPYLGKAGAREKGIRLTTFEEVLERADFLSVHATLTEETRHMISHEQLARMKPSAYLINAARGAIVDEDALVQALEAGQIAGAGLDVFAREPPSDSPMLGLENVVLTPHLGAATEEAQRKTGLLAVEQVLKAVGGEVPEFLVNPDVLAA